MKNDSIDKIIKEKFDSRVMTPSISAWDRLEAKLDDNDQKKKINWKSIFSYAASVIVLLGFGYNYFQSSGSNETSQAIILASKGVSNVRTLPSNDIVDVNPITFDRIVIEQNRSNEKDKKYFPKALKEKSNLVLNNEMLASSEVKKENVLKEQPTLNEEKSRIIVKGEDLLYAVTHSPEEVKNYYVANRIERGSVIDSIKIELRKRNLKVSPETILAQVEYEMLDSQFKGNFMQKIRLKISDIAVALAERNK
ncbi:hypothetical protein [Tenacibaculum xiamenense]|uniref:hypothetical protein n=1 Tax=Tenacibaculum xiamenense TaxID=1261553 RepID=UPI003894A379